MVVLYKPKSYNIFYLGRRWHTLFTIVAINMFEKIVRKLRKKKSNHSTFVNYDVNYKPLKVYSYSGRKVVVSRNKVKDISNDFYYELYSFKNLSIRYLLLMIFVVPMLSIYAIYCLIQETQKDVFPVISFILGSVAYSLFLKCRQFNEESVLRKQRKIHGIKFSTINEARVYWIRDKIGYEHNFLDFAEKLSKWKEHKEKYNRDSKINWFNYIYDPQSKPRILALFIAFISLFTVITINTFEIEPFSVLITFFGLKHILIEETWLILFLIFVICFLSWQLIFLGHILSRGIAYLLDFFNKNSFSELKFSILMSFLLDNADLEP